MVGWLLIVGGISGLITIIRAGSSESGFWWNLITAIVFILAGVSLLWQPLTGILTLTIILAAYLIASGLSKIAASFGYRRDVGRGWGWMLFSALVDLALGIIIVLGLPGVAGWVLGLLVGINLFFTGVALIMLALGAGAMTKTDGDAGAVPSS